MTVQKETVKKAAVKKTTAKKAAAKKPEVKSELVEVTQNNNEVITFEKALSLTGRKAVDFFSESENVLPLIEHVKKEALSLVPDVATTKGREAIGANAMKVSKSRKALEKAIDGSVEDLNLKVNKAKAVKTLVVAQLNETREAILLPRKEWQAEQDAIEEQRVNEIKAQIESIREIGNYQDSDDKDALSQKIDGLENIDVTDFFDEFTQDAVKIISEAISSLNARILYLIEEKKAQEQRELLALEQKKTLIQERLTNLVQIPLGLMGKPSNVIESKIKSLTSFDVLESEFEDRHAEAVGSVETVLGQLTMMLQQATMLETAAAAAAENAAAEAEAKQVELNTPQQIEAVANNITETAKALNEEYEPSYGGQEFYREELKAEFEPQQEPENDPVVEFEKPLTNSTDLARQKIKSLMPIQFHGYIETSLAGDFAVELSKIL